MRWFVSLLLIAALTAGCSGMTASLGYYNDSYYLRPSYGYSDPYYFDGFFYYDCPRHHSVLPLNCGSCHYVW